MVTRREVLGAGLALASASDALGLNSTVAVSVVKRRAGLREPGAIVLDEGLEASPTLVEFLKSRKPELPLLTLRLDSSTSLQLKPLFNSARAIAGLSSGATLFCLERIAWDYGYRISRRSEHEFSGAAADAAVNDATLIALVNAIISNTPELFAAAISPASRAYRPSLADGTLHAWMLQMTGSPKQRPVWPEIRQ